jgi:hypothetical protein
VQAPPKERRLADEPDGNFDLTVGNVPFGKVVLHDRAAQSRQSFNHFIIKSLRLTRPGAWWRY